MKSHKSWSQPYRLSENNGNKVAEMAFILNASLFCLCAALLYPVGLCTQLNSTDNDISNSSSEEIDIGKRIYGGLSRKYGDYDYVAQLTVYFSGSPRVRCSGVVLTDRAVLTVAHCLSQPGRPSANSVWVRLPAGGLYLFNKNEIFIHPKFNGIYGKDVAVLRKDWKGATYMRGFGKLPTLPQFSPTGTTYNNDEAVIAGWGRISDNIFSSRFQYADVTIMPDDVCHEKYPMLSSNMDENDIFICTYNSIAGICEGDWGGPILIKLDGKETVLAGLSMFTAKATCGSDNMQDTPSAYFEISPVIPWINNILNY